DITDLITNTLGGTIGIGLYLLIKSRLEDYRKIKTFVTICSTLTMILVTGMLLILFVVNN
ncbi:MAG: VanZ family protein, partial [Sarcina sp.]